jgi:hypothetical protein
MTGSIASLGVSQYNSSSVHFQAQEFDFASRYFRRQSAGVGLLWEYVPRYSPLCVSSSHRTALRRQNPVPPKDLILGGMSDREPRHRRQVVPFEWCPTTRSGVSSQQAGESARSVEVSKTSCSAAQPPPRLYRATDADSKGIIASHGGERPVWSLWAVSACDVRG